MADSAPAVNSANVQVLLDSNETQEQLIDKGDMIIDDDIQLHKPKKQKGSEVWSAMTDVEDPKDGENKLMYKCKHCHQLVAKVGSDVECLSGLVCHEQQQKEFSVIYRTEKKKLHGLLKNIEKISFTTDLWKSKNQKL